MNIEITNIRIFKIEKRGALLGYANVVLNDSFIIRGIKILEKEKGKFIAMPSRRTNKYRKEFRDICHPLNQDTRDVLTAAVIDAFENTNETINNNTTD